jgi:NAD(P)-dependent dehydrogenase (short-subunit alcohol dehydrogenase family)
MPDVNYDYSGRVALVTGAARGQGREHALAFARSGANVAICDIGFQLESVDYPLAGREDLERTATEVRDLGVRCLSMEVDVRDDRAVAALIADVVEELGRLDVLVNNAGVNSIHDVSEMPLEVWNDVLAINLSGVFHCSRHAARVMKQAGGGRIISTGSVNTGLSMPMNAAYTAAKHGVLGLTRAMAIDLAPHGINANVVSPGLVDTAILACAEAPHVPEDFFDRLLRVGGQVSLFTDEVAPLDPAVISGAVLWLASDAARFVTGAEIRVDAGFSVS